jgi:hypothetical protein
MKRNQYICLTLGAACLALLPLNATAQGDFDPAKMQEAVEKYGTPGPEHKILRASVGTWKADGLYWTAPGTEPMKSTGQSKCRMLLKGRYLQERFTSESPEMGKFEGLGTLGYDRLEKEFVHTWMDTMSTGIMVSRGKLSEDGATLEMRGQYKCPMTMQMVSHRFVSHLKDPDKHKLEMFVKYPDQPEYKVMEITYTRAEAPAKPGKEG